MAVDEREYARKRAQDRQQSVWYKMKEGDNRFRILPTPVTKTNPYRFFEYSVHRDVGPKKMVVRCGIDPAKESGDCWLCNVKIPALKKKGMNARADALAPKANFLVQIAKVDDDDRMTGPFLFTPSKTIADQLLGSIFGSKKRSYTDPVKGFNISINRTGTGKNDTRYGILEPDQEPTKVPKSILDKLKPFDELKEVPVYSADRQQAAYNGKDLVDDEEERPRNTSRRRSVVDEDDEDDSADVDTDEEEVDDTDEDDGDEEEAAAKSKSKAKSKNKDEDDEEDEDSDSEDDGDEDEEDSDSEDDGDEEDSDPASDDEDEEDEDEEEEAPESKSKSKPKPKSKSKKAEEDDEEIDLDDIPDDEADLDEEDEADEDEADEEEEEAPKPKAKAKKEPPAKSKKKADEPPTKKKKRK